MYYQHFQAVTRKDVETHHELATHLVTITLKFVQNCQLSTMPSSQPHPVFPSANNTFTFWLNQLY